MGCDFQSRSARTLKTARGASITRYCCFAEKLPDLWEGTDCTEGFCGFHDPRPGVSQEYAGGPLEETFGTALRCYVESQQLGKLATLDLCGLKMRLRNSVGIFELFRDYESDIYSTLDRIILEEASFYCPISLADIDAPKLGISFTGSTFDESVAIKDVTCSTLDFSDCRFNHDTFSIEGLRCRTINLSRAKLKTLKVSSSCLHNLILDDADIGTIELVGGSVGEVREDVDDPAADIGGFSCRAFRPETSGSIADLTLRNLEAGGPIDLRGRNITSALYIDNVRLRSPMKLFRNFCSGDLVIDNLKSEPRKSVGAAAEARLWERMYTELKLAALHVGDRALWTDFAIKEQDIRIERNQNPLAKFLLQMDKHISDNGTDITKPLIWLVFAVIAYTATFGLFDLLLTDRWKDAKNFFTFWTNHFSYAILQMVKPFNAIEKHVTSNLAPAIPIESSSNIVDSLMIVLACSESAVCLLLLASILFAARHHLSALN
jgi:uncharacterized protein YjbI with pentapeptide repeats